MKTIVKQSLSKFFVLSLVLMVPVISFCQSGPPGPGDDNPDVPFDTNMNLAFLAIGIVFAAVIIFRKLKQNRKALA